jgi:hypothetical protein
MELIKVGEISERVVGRSSSDVGVAAAGVDFEHDPLPFVLLRSEKWSRLSLHRRKDEIIRSDKRKSPYHLALPVGKVRGRMNEVIFCAAGVLSAPPLTYSFRRDEATSWCSASPSRKTRVLLLRA